MPNAPKASRKIAGSIERLKEHLRHVEEARLKFHKLAIGCEWFGDATCNNPDNRTLFCVPDMCPFNPNRL